MSKLTERLNAQVLEELRAVSGCRNVVESHVDQLRSTLSRMEEHITSICELLAALKTLEA